jgi:hypothetical protein
MKIKTLKKQLVIAISLGAVLLGVTAYAASTLILAVGTIQHSELFDGPATVTGAHTYYKARHGRAAR